MTKEDSLSEKAREAIEKAEKLGREAADALLHPRENLALSEMQQAQRDQLAVTEIEIAEMGLAAAREAEARKKKE